MRALIPAALAAVLLWLPASSQSVPKFKVLVVGQPDGNHPQTGAAGIKAVQEIAAGRDYAVDAATDLSRFTEAGLAQYQVMVCVMSWPGAWPKSAQAAFEAFIRSGKGWIGFHVCGLTGVSNPEWAWYQEWLGGVAFKSHPATRQNGTVKLETAAAAHPALAGVPASFSIHEEWYSWNKSPRGAADIRILATVDESSYAPGGSGMPGDHPVMWSNTRHGPMIYTALGHEPEAFANANVRRFLANAIPWAAQGGSTAAQAGIGKSREETPVLRWSGGRLVYAAGRDAAGRGADRRGLSNRFPW